MKKNIISLDLIQDIPAIETMAEGKLRGGFCSLASSGVNYKTTNENCENDGCTNDTCLNVVCSNVNCDNPNGKNQKCSSTTAVPIATSTPTPSGASLLGGGAFSILGF